MRFGLWGCITAVISLGGCGTAGPSLETLSSVARRELSPVEKVALAAAFAESLKDPGSAQFKWVPVVLLERDGGTFDYCGLVNSRNSYGGYAGFQKFYAQIGKNDKGAFTRGLIRTIASDDVNIVATDGLCEKHGYTDFTQAR
jgi:hypothetical protein